MKLSTKAILVISSFWSCLAIAGNVTVAHEFDGSEDTMPTSNFLDEWVCYPADVPASASYVEVGSFTVSETGEYRLGEIWLWLDAPGPVRGSHNTVLWIYDGPFDARNPTSNLHAFFEWGGWNSVIEDDFVELLSTQTYRLVLQKACSNDPGIGGFVIRGPGEINGVGYPTPNQFFGNFAEVGNENVADFPGWGTHLFADPYTFTAPRSGFYRFFDVSTEMGAGPAMSMVYSAPFDPADPSANLIAEPPPWSWTVTWVYLDAGQQVHVVQVDLYDEVGWYQTVLHPPGDLQGITSDFVGTYFDQAKKGQGFLVDMDDNFEYLFAALFTFTNAPVVALERDSASGKHAVGSSDQRWLTAYGPFSEDSNEVDLTFELTYGGRFNSTTPPADREDVGSGKLVAHDCENIDIQYSLPDGDGVFNLSRILPGFTRDCAAQVPVAPPVQ